MLRLRLCVGDIASWRGVDCVAVSTNRTLQGNENPTYWRFAGRKSVNGAVRSVGGPELAEACKAQALRRHCEVGEAVVTPAFGDLARRGCRHVVHVMVPDGLQIHGGGTDRHVQRMALPVMRQSFSAVLDAAADVGALSAAMPALGCGVNGWSPSLVAAAAAHALADAAAASGAVSAVDLIMGSQQMARAWGEVLEAALGPPTLEPHAADRHISTWQISPQQSASLGPLLAEQGDQRVSSDDASRRKSTRALRERLLLRVCRAGCYGNRP